MFVWAYAAAAGLAVAGVTGSGWALVTGQAPQVEILYRLDERMPLKVAALVLYGPLAFTRGGLSYLDQNPIIGLIILAIGVLWSFMQGVFILTAFFGFT